RKLSMTDAGRAFYERVRPILAEVADLELSLQAEGQRPSGRLRVSAPVSFGILHLGPAIAEYLQRYPDVVIDLDLNDRVVDLVEDGFDVAVRIGPLQDSSLVARPLAPQQLLVCAAPAYLKRHGTPKTPEDLKQHRCLHYAYASTGNEWHFEKDGVTHLVRVNAALRANNGDVLRTASLAGHGIILQPEFLVGDDIRAGRLITLLADYAHTPISMYAIYPHRRFLSPKVRSFVEHLDARFGSPALVAPGRHTSPRRSR
ncbi:MAG: substrate binding domain-containing protein, partial [Achromobacter pestifer]